METLDEYFVRIDKIKENVETVEELERRASDLFIEKKQLEALLKDLGDRVNHDIHLIREAFKDEEGFSVSIAEQYRELREEHYVPLEQVTYQLIEFVV